MELVPLYECIYNVYSTFNIEKFPVNCFTIAEKSGYKIKEFSDLTTKKQKAFIELSRDACFIEDTLFYVEHTVPGRIRFSIAHELGHIFLDTDSEDDADEFASHFLAPRILIHKYGCETSDQIHDRFGLSHRASNRALLNYKKWFDDIAHSTHKPSEPEHRLELMFFPEKELDCEIELETEPEEKYPAWAEYHEMLEQYFPERLYNYVLR